MNFLAKLIQSDHITQSPQKLPSAYNIWGPSQPGKDQLCSIISCSCFYLSI